MCYFKNPCDDTILDRKNAWEAVVQQIKASQPKIDRIAHHLEAKALYVFTMSRRLIGTMHTMGTDDLGRWSSIFVESYFPLFPMIELIGKAVSPKASPSPDDRLQAGFIWLNDPYSLPNPTNDPKADGVRLKALDKHLSQSTDGTPFAPQINELIKVRNYLFHGVSGADGEAFTMSYQHPYAMAIQEENALRTYWKNLCSDDSTISEPWITRLAQADIKPFPIDGWEPAKACLIDDCIVEYLENKLKSHFETNKK